MGELIFFLGGHDAEMLEIRNMLTAGGYIFHDRNLPWGARVSAYRREIQSLDKTQTPVLIELDLDESVPGHAIVIDHHGATAGKNCKTAIEQVAELLKISLNRHQILIAANDRGHVRAMQAMGATREEIAQIRKLDRHAQGVTEKDEEQARLSVKDRVRQISAGAVIVNSLTDKITAVTDLLCEHHKHVFVYGPGGETHYTGTGDMVHRLNQLHRDLYGEDDEARCWFGGDIPEFGFWGTEATIPEENIIKLVRIFSHHVFMFPFTIEHHPKDAKQHDSLHFFEAVKNALKAARWQEDRFKIQSRWKFNEYYYFHEHVRSALFDIDESDEQQSGTQTDPPTIPLMRYFKIDPGPGARFRIQLKGCAEDKSGSIYDLEIRHLSLRVFETRVGILKLELVNHDYDSFEDILRINDFGRRIYPAFLGELGGVSDTKSSFLADYIEMRLGIDEEPWHESFRELDFRRDHLQVAIYIRKLLGDSFTTDRSRFEADGTTLFFKPTIDDRMFVVCWYGADGWSRFLKKYSKKGKYAYENNEHWYRFIYIDGQSAGIDNPELMNRLIKSGTYARWAGAGTLFGLSRYSMVCLTGQNKWFGYHIARHHMRKMYTQMAIILLAQRASVLSFSSRVVEISKTIQRVQAKIDHDFERRFIFKKEFANVAREVEALHAAYIRFINRLWFTEITPQEQGIEMYSQAVGIMNLETHLKDLDREIKELYEFISLSHARMQNEQINRVTVLGAILLSLSVITGFLGMNTDFIEKGLKWIAQQVFGFFNWPIDASHPSIYHEWATFALSGIAFVISFFVILLVMRHIVRRIDPDGLDITTYLKVRHYFGGPKSLD